MNIKEFHLTAFMLFVYYFAYVQNEPKGKPNLIFNEFTLSVNQTAVENANTSNRMGFGMGVYRTWRDSSWFNLVSGIAYNNTNQFKKHITLGHFASYSDATFSLHSFSVPFLMRFKFGNKTKFFFETGVFAEVTTRGICKATSYVYTPDNGAHVKEIKERSLSGMNVGALLGLGTIIPVNGYGILAKIGYQFGIPGYEIGHETVGNVFLSTSLGFRLK